jgi:hypothetical protein
MPTEMARVDKVEKFTVRGETVPEYYAEEVADDG